MEASSGGGGREGEERRGRGDWQQGWGVYS